MYGFGAAGSHDTEAFEKEKIQVKKKNQLSHVTQ